VIIESEDTVKKKSLETDGCEPNSGCDSENLPPLKGSDPAATSWEPEGRNESQQVVMTWLFLSLGEFSEVEDKAV